MELVKPSACPMDLESLPKCTVVKVSGLCDADGECKNTNNAATTCGEYDVYNKIAASLLESASEDESDATSPCGRLQLVKPNECPRNPEKLPKCNVVKVHGLCEADGECKNTNKEANNCGEYDVYTKIAASLLE